MKKETKSKDAPREHKQPWQEKDGDAIYAQAYALYQQGFQYWFSPNEIRKMAQHNERFETVHSELELVDLHFRKPKDGEPRELVSATMALQMIGANVAYTLSKEKIGQAFVRLGFEAMRKSAQRGYIAVHRSGLEMEEYRRKLADEAMTDDSMTAGFWNLSRTARVYAVREDFITFTVIVSYCHTISRSGVLFLAVVFISRR